jgi:hypothetical protein
MLKHARKVSGHGLSRQYSDRWTSIEVLDVDDATRAAARGVTFACPGCERIVIPVFFAVSNPGALHSEQSHFRLKGVEGEPRPMRHIVGCRHYVEPVISEGRAGTSAPGTTRRRLGPSIFVDELEPDPVRSVTLLPRPDDEDTEVSWSSRGRRRHLAGARVAESRANDLAAFAGPFHHRYSALQSEPLQLNACPAKTYGGVFRRIDGSLARSMPGPGERFIYWFQPTQVENWGMNLGLPLRLQDPDGLELYVYIERSPGGEQLPESFVRFLQQLTPSAPLTAYVLGSFQRKVSQGKFRLSPVSIRHVHLEHGHPSG